MTEFIKKLEEFIPKEDAEFTINFAKMMLILHQVVTISDAYFQKMGTSKGRFLILVRLLLSNDSTGESISVLRSFYPISYAAISGVLDTLEKDDMIVRHSTPNDRRKVNIKLTEKGRDFIITFLPFHVESIRTIGANLNETEIEQMFDSLKQIINGFEQLHKCLSKNPKGEVI